MTKKGKLRSLSAMITEIDYDKISIITETSQRSTSYQVESILSAALAIPAMKDDVQARAFHLLRTDPNHKAACRVLKSYGWQQPAESTIAPTPPDPDPEPITQPIFTVADLVPDEDSPRVRVVAIAAGSIGSEATPVPPPGPAPVPVEEVIEIGDSSGARGLISQ